MQDHDRPLVRSLQDEEVSTKASFTRLNRIKRVVWRIVWLTLASWTPPALFAWRAFLLRRFGASIGAGARVYPSASIWLPENLVLGDCATIGPRVLIYNQGRITIGPRALISQGAHLCASTHDYTAPTFQLVLRPIVIGRNAWIASEAFVGPGVTIGEGAILAARGVAVRNMDPWAVHGGNPARLIKSRDPASVGTV